MSDLFGDFGSLYVQQDDVDPSVIEVIAAVEGVEFKRDDGRIQKRVVLHFRNGLRPLPLNSTNRAVLMEIYGLTSRSPLDSVVGKRICLYRDPSVMMGGKRVGGTRICLPEDDPTRKKPRSKPGREQHPSEQLYAAGGDDGGIEGLQSDPQWEEGRE